MMKESRFAPPSHVRGFSAVEVIAVATIIAILALILIPVLTSQVDKSKLAAASDELSSLAKVISLAQAETNRYFRLQDYDNTSQYDGTANIINDPTTEVPVTYWGMTMHLTTGERRRLARIWDGPRTNFHKFSTLQDLYSAYPGAFTQITPPGQIGLNVEGPIHVFVTRPLGAGNPSEPFPTQDERHDLYPLDPWGNPYLFFAPGIVSLPGGTQESIYSPIIYSMGPNGVPGNAGIPQFIDYYPGAGRPLGTGDDITWKF